MLRGKSLGKERTRFFVFQISLRPCQNESNNSSSSTQTKETFDSSPNTFDHHQTMQSSTEQHQAQHSKWSNESKVPPGTDVVCCSVKCWICLKMALDIYDVLDFSISHRFLILLRILRFLEVFKDSQESRVSKISQIFFKDFYRHFIDMRKIF